MTTRKYKNKMSKMCKTRKNVKKCGKACKKCGKNCKKCGKNCKNCRCMKGGK